MFDVYIIFLLFHSVFCKTPIIEYESINVAHNCLIDILKKYYWNEKKLTFVDLGSDDNEVLKSINKKLHMSVISRTWTKKLKTHNPGYVIAARRAQHIIKYFKNLSQEAEWNPLAKFVVLIELLDRTLFDMFNEFLHLHIINIIVINGTIDPDLYTYNPYDNYGCGKRFDRIISYGKCTRPLVSNLFPKKFTLGLRNCTINIATPHWPPYSIDPTTQTTTLLGIEEYVFKIISEIKQFTTNYTYTNDSEEFTLINDNMRAVGPLELLQTNKVDVIFGGLILIKSRADAFDYIYAHLAYDDDLRIMVKRSLRAALWKNLYLEFSPIVWFMIVVSSLAYFLFFVFFLRVMDKSSIMLKMWDSLFSHGQKIPRRGVVKFAFMLWVWYAHLINSYYQSVLYSLTTKPAWSYQISNEEDLITYKIKPCVSTVIRSFLSAEGMYNNNNDIIEKQMDCQSYFQSIAKVSNTFDMFTMVLYRVYYYNHHDFLSIFGTSKLYSFSPMSKILYAIYFYKGFPMRDEFQELALRMRESGLLDKVTNDLFYEQEIKYHFANRLPPIRIPFTVIVPWYLLCFGMALATFVFSLEIFIYRNKDI